MGKPKKNRKPKNKQGKDKKPKGPPMADSADRYALYQRSVQAPEVDAGIFREAYKRHYDRWPTILREDFCGTAAVCCEWVKLSNEAQAYGIDLDPEPLEWGRENNVGKLSDAERARVHLSEGDVRTATTPKADVLAAQNFSYFIFKTRAELRSYFEIARAGLADEGVLIVDLFGGSEVMEDGHQDVVEHDGFEYLWDEASFDPITHDCKFHIHFRFKDGSALKKAFTYEWRLWSIPEVRELLLEAGFSNAEVCWEGTDEKTGEGNGQYDVQEHGDADPAWTAYIVAAK